MQRSSKSDSVRPDAGALKAGFGDETPQLAFGISAPHQAPEDSACNERVSQLNVHVGNVAVDVRSVPQTAEKANQVVDI
jgi:hypothetical protein